MSKFTPLLLVAICLIAVCATLATAGSVTVKFADEKVIAGYPAYLSIDLQKVRFNDDEVKLAFDDKWFSLIDEDDDYLSLAKALTPKLGGVFNPFFCVDSVTGQASAVMDLQDSVLTLANPIAQRSTVYTEDDAATTQQSNILICSIVVSKVPPAELKYTPTFTDETGTSTTPDEALVLTFPAKGLVKPSMNLKSLSLNQGKRAYSYNSIEIEFTTDTVGVYKIDMNDGQTIPQAFRLQNDKLVTPDFFCTSGSDKQAARIVLSEDFALVVIDKVSTSSYKCNFASLFAFSSINNQKLLFSLQLGDYAVDRATHMAPFPTSSLASLKKITNQDDGSVIYSIEARTVAHVSSNIHINTNSTIVFKFGDQLNLNSLIVSDNGYQGFRCDSFGATIFVNEHDITLKDITEPSESAFCTFNFNSLAFHHQDDDKMTSLEIIIDGDATDSLFAPDKSSPLYLYEHVTTSSGNPVETETIFKVSTEIQTEFKDAVYSVTETFTINDNYKAVGVTPNNVVLILSQQGGNYKAEDFASQVTCTQTTPSQSQFFPLELKFDQQFYSWTAPLKSLTNVESYSILIECKYKVNQIVVAGLDITPTNGLLFQIINLVDQHRYTATLSPSVQYLSRVDLGESTALPEKRVFHSTIEGYMVSPKSIYSELDAIYKEIQTQLTAQWASMENDNGDKFVTDYSLNFVGLPTFESNEDASSDPFYGDSSTQQVAHNYFFNTLKNEYAMHTSLSSEYASVPQAFSYIAATPDGLKKSTDGSGTGMFKVGWSQRVYIELKNTAPKVTTADITSFEWENDVYGDIYVQNVKKVVGTDMFVPVEQTSISQASYSQYLTYGSNVFRNSVAKCGYKNGAIFYDDISSPNFGTAWVANQFYYATSFTCTDTEECAVNADCNEGLLCLASKCTPALTVASPYVLYESVFIDFQIKQYYGSAMTFSSFFAVCAVVVALMF